MPQFDAPIILSCLERSGSNTIDRIFEAKVNR